METSNLTMAQQVALAASEFQQQCTGHSPQTVAAVLSGETLVITLQQALSPAELALAMTPAGAAQVQEFHRQLFVISVDMLRDEIKRITGVEVGESAAEVVSATGIMVQVFLLAHGLPDATWNGRVVDDWAVEA
ncbi:MAG: DUF2294 family protein [Planctomycetaceae bacterium]|nr:MAG: DUF2294 family protein [Planctomycetaceae bacterium]